MRWKVQGFQNALAGLSSGPPPWLSWIVRWTTNDITSAVISPWDKLPDLPHQVRLASLPLASEHICTENLTPFLKLLPCKCLSGNASLLDPHRLFDADSHGMGLHVLWRKEEGVELRLTFQSVRSFAVIFGEGSSLVSPVFIWPKYQTKLSRGRNKSNSSFSPRDTDSS